MDQATNAADASVDDVRDLTERQTLLQTEYIKNENRVNAAEGMRTIANIQSISMMFIYIYIYRILVIMYYRISYQC